MLAYTRIRIHLYQVYRKEVTTRRAKMLFLISAYKPCSIIRYINLNVNKLTVHVAKLNIRNFLKIQLRVPKSVEPFSAQVGIQLVYERISVL